MTGLSCYDGSDGCQTDLAGLALLLHVFFLRLQSNDTSWYLEAFDTTGASLDDNKFGRFEVIQRCLSTPISSAISSQTFQHRFHCNTLMLCICLGGQSCSAYLTIRNKSARPSRQHKEQI